MRGTKMEISSTSRARCFDFALDFLGCFDFALDFLGWFDGTFGYQFSSTISSLQTNVRLLQSFDLYLSKCRRRRRNHEACLEQDEVEKDVVSFRIRDLIIRRMQHLEFFCSEYFSDSRSPDLTEIKSELTRFRKAIKLFFKTDLNKSCINFLLDYHWLRDPELVFHFIDSVSKTLAELLRAIPAFRQPLIAPVKTLEEKVVFLKHFIRFAILHGVEGVQLIDLLIHAEVVAINSLRLISIWSSDRYDEEVPNEMGLQISRLIREKINLSDPQVRDTYIHVLAASKLPRSSDVLALEKNKHLVADFIDCLVHKIMELPEICFRIPVPMRNQMQKLHKGLTFLTIILRHQRKFNGLCNEMKNLIGVVVCDAAIVIFSLSLNQLIEEGLARETDLSFFHLLKALKFIRAEVAQFYQLTSLPGSKDFLQKNLEELIQTTETVQKDIEFLRSFLEKSEEQCDQNQKLQAFWNRVMDVAKKADLVINSTIVARDINLIKIEAQEIYNSVSYDGETKRATKAFSSMPSQAPTVKRGTKTFTHMPSQVTQVFGLTSLSGFGFPRTNELGSMDFLLENLELESRNEADDSIAFSKDQIHAVLGDLAYLRSFLGAIVDQRNENKNLQALWSQVMEVSYKAELVIDSTLVGDGREYHLDAVARDINLIKAEAQEIYASISNDGETNRVTRTFTRTPLPSQVAAATYNEDLVGRHDEVRTITDRLTRGSRQLDVIPIVGMHGLGKTTLANTVYSSRSVTLHFHIRGWCTVSQAYSTRDLLEQILNCIGPRSSKQYLNTDEYDLAVKLKQYLLGHRYLLVLDDLWDVEAWKLLERSLPDDDNGSRVLITSRLHSLPLQFKPDNKPHHLRQFTDEESWKLLQKKLFGKEGCPAKLSGIGRQIAESCRGLPLKIVLVAGILTTSARNFWEEVAESLSSSIVLDDEHCMKTLELSYSHLPGSLKQCLLYFGAFQQDENIPVRRLLWLWISEGFVRATEGKSLEEVADDYLKALVDRSLVMVTKQRTTGGAKTCRIHDLVHEFCVKKAKEDDFLHVIRGGKDPSSLTGLSNTYRVCDQNASNSKISEIVQFSPNIRSLLLFKKSGLMPKEEDLGSKLLRVLDLGNLVFDAYFLNEVVLLVHLRYLALHIQIGEIESIPTAIANLSRLQTFLVRGNSRNTLFPVTIWNIKTLRHLCMTSSDYGFTYYGFTFPVENLEVSPGLDHLYTLDLAIDPSSQSLQSILTKLPSIHRLKCSRVRSRRGPARTGNRTLVFDCLSQLESLNLRFFDGYGFTFPLNLKKLTLSRNKQPWGEISTIAKLPNLEVLKLLYNSFVGEEWEMQEEDFPNLRALKLIDLMNFQSWTASSDNFPRLEKLVVHNCWNLEEVPSCLGECLTLQMIEVKGCGESVVSSVKQIQQEQMDMGNEDLKIIIENLW